MLHYPDIVASSQARLGQALLPAFQDTIINAGNGPTQGQGLLV